MKSSERLAYAALWFCVAAAAVMIGMLRPRLAGQLQRIKAEADPLLLPPPEQVLVGSLGYRAAVADFLYAHTLVWSGQHAFRKRRMEFVANYLDIVTTLDPKFREPYYFADTLITLQTVASKPEDYRAARRLLERGMRERPHDAELWVNAGQFMAYIAPPYLGDDKEAAEWKLEGARRMARACELVGSNEAIPFNCITAARLFERAGDRESMIRFLERVLAVTDDPEIQMIARNSLLRAQSEQQRERAELRRLALDEHLQRDLSAVKRTKHMVLGPGFDPAACAGRALECVTSYREWGQRFAESMEP